MQSSSRILPAGAALVCAALVCAALASPAAAHHSFRALFEMDSSIEIEGRITEILWVNPHIKIYVASRDEQIWEVEAGPVNLLSTLGIDRSMLEVGETIRVRGNPARHTPRALWVSNILLADRTELIAAPEAQPHLPWAALRTVGGGTIDPTPVSPLPDGFQPSFFRVWSARFPGFPRPRGEPVLTEAGERAQARYQIGEQAIADCEVPGMPFAMISPYPIEIVQQGDRLLIRGEAYDLTRVVHLAEPPSPPAPSPLGVSVARIAGNELIIETSRIAYHSYGDLGPAQSEQSHVVERFTLSTDGLTLDYDITVTDPVMLREPWSWGGSFVYSGDEIEPWNACGVESGHSGGDPSGEPPATPSWWLPWAASVAVVLLLAAAAVGWLRFRAA